MGMREKLIARVQPLLPGETIQQVFLAQSGVSPWIGNTFGFLGQAVVRRRIVAVTERAIVVFSADFNGTKPKELLRRLPRGTKIGPAKGLWSPINLGGDEKAWTHSRFHKDVQAADAVSAG
jgi:hypothetical protein